MFKPGRCFYYALYGHGGETYIFIYKIKINIDCFDPEIRAIYRFHQFWWRGNKCILVDRRSRDRHDEKLVMEIKVRKKVWNIVTDGKYDNGNV